ncbi:hypothetical protein N7456_004564 [Penicillium angulare]|uniref:Uncharacterized protein n=1 Tax=Penicillium angulare TaxID=116970 RepID=A0A9W9FWV0_9EURO|nr:hypothetical protein N7456_004564 [Penicillium angulare]
MATAGIAMCLILVYFLVIYDPALDPFSKQGDQTSNPWFRSNPVDKIFLQTVRYVPKGFMRSLNVSYSKVEQIITKCLLAMSDA